MGVLDPNFVVPIDTTVDPFEVKAQADEQAVMISVMGGQEFNPDQMASDLKLADEVKKPVELISDTTRSGLQTEAGQMQTKRDTRDAPVLRSFLTGDTVLPALVHDDLPGMAGIERAAKDLTFTGAFSQGVDLLQGLGWRSLEAAAEAAGFGNVEEFAQRKAEREFAQAQAAGVKQKFTDIRTAGDFFTWMKQTAGEQIPLMAPSVAGSLTGAAAGTVVGGPVGTVVGGVLGAFIPSFVLGMGETQQAIKERDVTVEAPGFAFGAGALIGALDSALPGKVGSKLVKAFGVDIAEQVVKLSATRIMRNAAVEGSKGTAIEGITEAIQEVISETAAATATDTEIDSRDLAEQMVEAFAAGAFMGGSVGVTTSASTDLIKARRTTSASTDLIKARRTKQAMDLLSEKVGDSKLNTRAPDKSAEVTAAQMKEGGVESIFVPVDVILAFANQHPEGRQAALDQLGITQDLETAIREETDVEIDATSFSRTVLGRTGYNILALHFKTSRKDKSFNEAAEALALDEEATAEIEADIEAYDASEELKARVTETVQKLKPGEAAKVLDEASLDVRAVLDNLFQRVEERKGDVSEVVREGRLAQLDEEISQRDREIAATESEIEARKAEGKPTKRLENKLAKLAAERDIRVEEQTELGFETVAVGVGPTVQAEFKAKVEEKVRPKAIKTKAKVLQDLNVKITTEAIRATRTAFKAGLKAGETLVGLKTEVAKAIDTLPLTLKQKKKLGDRIFKAKTVGQFRKTVAAVQSRAAVLVESERRKQIKAAVKKTLAKTAAKRIGGKLVGKFDADVQAVLDMARETMAMGAEAAKVKLEVELADPLPSPEKLFERQLLALAANDENMSNVDAENLLIDLNKIKETGKLAGLARVLAKREAKNRDVKIARKAVTQGEPTPELKTTGFFQRMRKKGQNIQTSLSSWHNGWDEILDINFNKKLTEALLAEGITQEDIDTLVKNLRMTKQVQNFKGRVMQWEQELEEIGMRVYRLDGQQDLHEKHVGDSTRIDYELHVNKRGETVRLEYSKAEIRKFWMEMQDPTLAPVFTEEHGMAFTDEMLDTLFDTLTDQDKQYAREQLDFYKRLYPQVNAVYRRIYGVNLPFNEFYSPIQRDLKKVKEGEGDQFGSDLVLTDEQTLRRSLPKQIKSRTENITPLMRRSDVGAMRQYLHDMAWFVESTEQVLHIKSVFANQKLRGDIEAQHGTNMVAFIDSFLEDFGTGYAARGNIAEKTLNAVNRLFASSVLSLKGTIGTKQLVSWFAMADNVPAADFIASHLDFFKSRTAAKEIIKFLWENSQALRARGSNLDFELAKIGALEEPVFKWKKQNVWEKWKFAIIRMGDRFPIYAGGWAVYQHARKQGKSHKEAIAAFEDAFTTTQQSTDIDKLSAMQRMGAVGRTLTLLMNARMALMRGEIRAFRQFKRGKIGWREFGKRLAYYHFIMPMMIQYIASGFRWEKDRQAIAALLGQINSLVIFGDVLMLGAEFLLGKDKPFQHADEMPLSTMLKDMAKGFDDAISADGDMEEMLIAIKDMAIAISPLTGQPVDQVANIIGGVNDVVEGKAEKGLKRVWGFSERVAEESSR